MYLRRLAATALATLTIAAGGVAATTTPAEAARRCTGTKSTGVCYTVSHVSKKLKVMQSIPLENHRKKKGTVTFHCNFSDTLSRSLTATAGVTTGAKVTIIKVAEVSVSYNLSLSVSQTSTRAESAAADVPLKRGEGVLCQRTYGYVKANVLETHYSASNVWTRKYSVSIPVRVEATDVVDEVDEDVTR